MSLNLFIFLVESIFLKHVILFCNEQDGPRAFISASSLPVERASQDPIDPTKAVPR